MSDIFLMNTEKSFIINIYTIGYDRQGESIYISIESKNKEFFYDILIDCYKTTKNITKELLKRIKKEEEINCICLSHYHDDHIYGLDEILKDYSKKNTLVLVPDVDCEKSLSDNAKRIRSEIANLVKNGCKNKGTVQKVSNPNIIINRKIFVEDKELEFEILAISPLSNITMRNVDRSPKDIEQNDYSISLLITLGNLRLLFTGDVMNNTLRCIDYKYDINFLKIPHHGSNDSDKIFDIANLNRNTVCVSTNYTAANLPSTDLLDKYIELTDELYITQKDSKEDFGIIQAKYELNIENNTIIYDVKNLYNSKKYIKKQVWTY